MCGSSQKRRGHDAPNRIGFDWGHRARWSQSLTSNRILWQQLCPMVTISPIESVFKAMIVPIGHDSMNRGCFLWESYARWSQLHRLKPLPPGRHGQGIAHPTRLLPRLKATVHRNKARRWLATCSRSPCIVVCRGSLTSTALRQQARPQSEASPHPLGGPQRAFSGRPSLVPSAQLGTRGEWVS